MEERNKISKIIEEMTLYLLAEEVNEFDFHFSSNENTEIIFVVKNTDSYVRDDIMKNVVGKRNRMIEEYGWELIGEGDDENSLDLISSLIDECEFKYNNGLFEIRMVRYE